MDSPDTHLFVEDKNPFRARMALADSSLQPPLQRQRSSSSPSSSIEHTRNEFRDNLKQQQTVQRRKSHRHSSRPHPRKNRVLPDVIDQLDNVNFMQYHHEGPYDAVYPERNVYSKRSPLEAVRDSNEETLRATPMYKIIDSVYRHRPLDGVAYYPPGVTDEMGHTYMYTEGDNMMTETHGRFPRAPGAKFTEEDFKNDPFYQNDNQRPPRRMGSLRKALSTLKTRSGKNTA
ncbi:hypothetical protein BGW36DRAFT_391597 [Talaromyces proteolyticus]|uniref:Pal1 cell morphology n=1 Tax=Talaromyces proteolyticus TaxID=1131652 RepID=A0AAD4KCY0_9EURO|nr:uncharacterized protein BGW36DRAFT_391597 [Talaromyces proteolyticus]KAH8689034.1 hypothetical protein BGW36DRAFT_391597 [Talaromyces proteolyticus]